MRFCSCLKQAVLVGGIFLALFFGNHASARILDDQTLSRLDGLKLGDLDSECLLDLLNDRFGIQLGDPFQLVGGGLNFLSGGLDSAGESIQEAAGFSGGDPRELGFGEALGAGVGGAVRGVGDIVGAVGDGVGAVGSVINGFSDINNVGTGDLLDAFFPTTAERPVYDGGGLRRSARFVRCNIEKGIITQGDLIFLALRWTMFLLTIAATGGVVAGVWAGFTLITSFGDSGRMETAKKTMIGVVGGIILILGAYAIVSTFMTGRFGAVREVRQEIEKTDGDGKIIEFILLVGAETKRNPEDGKIYAKHTFMIKFTEDQEVYEKRGRVNDVTLMCRPTDGPLLCDHAFIPVSPDQPMFTVTMILPYPGSYPDQELTYTVVTDKEYRETFKVLAEPAFVEKPEEEGGDGAGENDDEDGQGRDSSSGDGREKDGSSGGRDGAGDENENGNENTDTDSFDSSETESHREAREKYPTSFDTSRKIFEDAQDPDNGRNKQIKFSSDDVLIVALERRLIRTTGTKESLPEDKGFEAVFDIKLRTEHPDFKDIKEISFECQGPGGGAGNHCARSKFNLSQSRIGSSAARFVEFRPPDNFDFEPLKDSSGLVIAPRHIIKAVVKTSKYTETETLDIIPYYYYE